MLLFFAFLFAPQFSNALWNTDATQISLYGTSAAVQNAQIIVDLTSTELVKQAIGQRDRISTLESEEAVLSALEADLNVTGAALESAIFATQTAEVVANSMQRTQAAIDYEETQIAFNQQSTRNAAQATQTQQALSAQSEVVFPTNTEEPRPFRIDGIEYTAHPDSNCDTQIIAGRVLNLDDDLTGDDIMQVRVLSADGDLTVTVGDNLELDDTYNWAIEVNDTLTGDVYFFRLETIPGDSLSPMERVIFDGTCEQNLAIVTFAQGQSDGE